MLTRLVTVKVAAAALGAMAVGGVAVAAVTGGLPSQRDDIPVVTPATSTLPEHAPAVRGGTPDTQSTEDKGAPPERATTGKNGDGEKNSDENKNGAASPAPSPAGLCQAYRAGGGNAKALENPSFSVLIATAGGKDKVPGYCATVLDKRPPVKPADPPGRPATPPAEPRNEQSNGKRDGPPAPAHSGR